jgi:hypothetical protein
VASMKDPYGRILGFLDRTASRPVRFKSRGTNSRYILGRRFGGIHGLSKDCGEEKKMLHCRESNPGHLAP